MRAEITAIVITDEVLFSPAGDIGRWRASVTASMTRNAKRHAPVNQRTVKSRANARFPAGSLQKMISSQSRNITLRQFEIVTTSDAPYSLYVIKGTKRIYSRSARVPAGEVGAGQFRSLRDESGERLGMYLPPGMGHGALFRQSVRGQRANNFLAAAFDSTAVRHPSLHGYSMG